MLRSVEGSSMDPVIINCFPVITVLCYLACPIQYLVDSLEYDEWKSYQNSCWLRLHRTTGRCLWTTSQTGNASQVFSKWTWNSHEGSLAWSVSAGHRFRLVVHTGDDFSFDLFFFSAISWDRKSEIVFIEMFIFYKGKPSKWRLNNTANWSGITSCLCLYDRISGREMWTIRRWAVNAAAEEATTNRSTSGSVWATADEEDIVEAQAQFK